MYVCALCLGGAKAQMKNIIALPCTMSSNMNCVCASTNCVHLTCIYVYTCVIVEKSKQNIDMYICIYDYLF